MRKLNFHIEKELKGRFELKRLNLLLVFQVNCPGCFTYALPMFNKLYNEFTKKDVSFLGVSTAFEDFDKNTLKNTIDLIENGTLIGETKKALYNYGYDKLPYNLNFPIAMDSVSKDSSIDIENIVKIILTYYKHDSETSRKLLESRIKNYLNSLDKISLTFTLNQLKGTPSFILFNADYKILNNWFGHVSYEEIQNKIKESLQ